MSYKLTRVAVLVACCLLVGLTTAQAQTSSFTISSGPMGGDWYSLGGALGEMAKEAMPGAVVTVTTGGAVENLPKVNGGQSDLGLTMAKLYHEALTGTESFASRGKQENVRAMAFLANIPMSFFLVKEGNPLASIEEIKAQKKKVRILTSKKGSSPALAAELMLGKYGITFQDIKTWGGSVGYVSYAEAANLIKDGHADAWIGPMVSGIVELTTTEKMKMLPIAPAALDKLRDEDHYVRITLPKGKYYFVKADTPHMAEAVILIVRKNVPDKDVYALTKAVLKNPDRVRAIHQTYAGFDPSTAWQNVGGPLHPGAEKCFREMGFMK
ncbi:MAG: TAXI family TRAP transporter solute-binding subunit [Desulfobacteraceae bacterium]|nr:MAG: TAXI family TRAP transporter solute-binding subunit [Desulfobacteraceae bacterium]